MKDIINSLIKTFNALVHSKRAWAVLASMVMLIAKEYVMLEQKYSLWVTVPLTGLLGCMCWFVVICVVSCIAGCDCFTTIKHREFTSDEAIRELEQRYHAQIEYREHPGHGNVPIEELNSVLEFKEDSK